MAHKLSAALLGGVVVAVMAGAPVQAGGNNHGRTAKRSVHKLDEALRESLEHAPKPERVIIKMKAGREGAMKNALRWHGDVVEQEHRSLGALTAVVHGEDLEAIANDPAVHSVSIDARVRGQAARNNASARHAAAKAAAKKAAAKKAAAKAARVKQANQRKKASQPKPKAEVLGDLRKLQGLGLGQPTGAGVGVAVIDSGIEPSRDISANVSAFYDFTQGKGAVRTSPYDDYGHGTHIASLIANQGTDKGEYQGVAPGAHLIGLKVLDENGNGRTSDVIAAIEFAVHNKVALDIDVINLSLGHPVFESAATDPLVQAVESAGRAGIVVVVSAGNFGMNPKTHQVGYGGTASPGNAPSAVTFGAVDDKNTVGRGDDTVAPFSSRGPAWIDGLAKPDLVASGVGEVGRASSTGKLYKLYPQALTDDDEHIDLKRFAKLSGTSMAAAVGSGVAALVLQANGGLKPNAVKAVLEYTATPIADVKAGVYDALTQGAGEVNGAGAIALAGVIDASMPWGTPWVAVMPPASTTFGTETVAWSQNIVWGNYHVGGNVLAFSSEAWGENIVWGSVGRDYDGDGDNIVWGTLADRDQDDNIVWGTSVSWDDNIVWGNMFQRDGDNIVWGTFTRDDDNIVWGSSFDWDENIVWGNSALGSGDGDNIVWGNVDDTDNIVWGNLDDDNIVWGNSAHDDDDDNIVWGNSDDNVVWGTAILLGLVK